MNRRGFALLAVLWVLVALSGWAAAVLLLAREGAYASRNRLILARANWAREACIEILEARYAADRAVRTVDTVRLGRGSWCRARLEDPSGLVNLNTASPGLLRGVLGNDSLVAALMDWRDPDTLPMPLGAERPWYREAHRRRPDDRPFESVAELQLVRGFERIPLESLQRRFTTVGIGAINLNRASPEVLALVPGLDAAAVAELLALRRSGTELASFDALASRLAPSSRRALFPRFEEFSRTVTFAPERLVLRAEGGVSGYGSVAQARLEVVQSGARLAVVRREVQ